MDVPPAPPAPPAWTREAIEEWLLQLARAIMDDHNINATHDLFIRGFDRCAVSSEQEVEKIAHRAFFCTV